MPAFSAIARSGGGMRSPGEGSPGIDLPHAGLEVVEGGWDLRAEHEQVQRPVQQCLQNREDDWDLEDFLLRPEDVHRLHRLALLGLLENPEDSQGVVKNQGCGAGHGKAARLKNVLPPRGRLRALSQSL
eukprot:1713121-Rhodomonas_salina.3